MKRQVSLLAIVSLLLWAVSLNPAPANAYPLHQGGQPITASNAANVKQLAVLDSQKQAVFGLAFSPDGKMLASASIDKTVVLWDAATDKPLFTLEGHTAQAVAVAFSADGATLYSVGYDPAIRLWDVKTGKQTGIVATDAANNRVGPLMDNLILAFNKDSSLLAYGMDTGGLFLWDMKANTQTTLEADTPFVGVAFSPDGTMIAATANIGDQANLIKLYDVKSGALKTTLTAPDGTYYGYVALSPDGNTLAVVNATNDPTTVIELWDLTTGKMVTTLKGHTGSVYALAFNIDGTLLATGSYDHTLRLWDVKAGKELVSLPSADQKGGIAALKFNADGTMIASAGLNGAIQLWGFR